MKKILYACILILSLILTGCANNTGNATTDDNDSSTSAPNSTNAPTPPQTDESTPNDPEPNKPQSDTLPSGYLDETDDTEYIISEQLGEPQEIITTIETANFNYTIFIPELESELSLTISEKGGHFFCLHEYGKLYKSSTCSLIIYFQPMTLTYLSSAGGKVNMIFSEGISVISKNNQEIPNSTSIIATSQQYGNNVILVDSTLVEFSDSTFILSQEKNDVLIDTLNLYF